MAKGGQSRRRGGGEQEGHSAQCSLIYNYKLVPGRTIHKLGRKKRKTRAKKLKLAAVEQAEKEEEEREREEEEERREYT